VYGDTGGHNAKLGGYASMAPCIPSILTTADLPQIASLACPKPLSIVNPVSADGEKLSSRDAEAAFAWARKFYDVSGHGDRLAITCSTSQSR